MTATEYETFVLDSAYMGLKDDLYNFVGLAGETGECMEWVKKAVLRKDPAFTEDMLKLELGDVLHYVTRIALNHGWGLDDLMVGNIRKLKARLAKT